MGIPFMLVGPLLVVVCALIYVVTSLPTPAMDVRQVGRSLLGSSAGISPRAHYGDLRPQDGGAAAFPDRWRVVLGNALKQ